MMRHRTNPATEVKPAEEGAFCDREYAYREPLVEVLISDLYSGHVQ